MVEQPRSPLRWRASRNVVVGATALALAVGWFALARPSGQPARPSVPSPPGTSYPPDDRGLTPVFTIAHVLVRGEVGDIAAYRGPAGDLCIQLTTEGTISCDLLPRPGHPIRVAYANWLYLYSAGEGFGVFVVGAIRPRVSSVHVSLGAAGWVNATILKPPPELHFPFRLFYLEERTGYESLSRSLPVVARDAVGREIGRNYYVTCSLLTGGWCFRFLDEARKEP